MLRSVVFACFTVGWAISPHASVAQAPQRPAELSKLQDFARRENLEILVYESGGRVHYVHGAAAKLVYGPPDGSSLAHHAYPTLSPDGERIAFVRSVAVGKEQISVYNIPDGKLADLYRWDGKLYGLSWSPSGNQIAFVAEDSDSRNLLGAVEIKSGHGSKFLPNDLGLEGRVSIDSPPSWSADGQRIAIELDQQAGGPYKRGVAIVDLTLRKGRPVAEGESPSWSPTGRVIAYCDLRKRTVLTIKPDGSGKKKLFSPYPLLGGPTWPGGLTLPLLWSADESMVGYNEIVGEGPAYSFSSRNLKNGNRQKIYSNSRLTVVVWRKVQNH